MAAASFGLLALFARALGGYVSDKVALRGGLNRRVTLLFVLMLGEGLGLLWFAHAGSVVAAVVAMLCFGLFTHMACGATYALVPSSTARRSAAWPASSAPAATSARWRRAS
jgi:NNP family nitrate/nitrite transporter-like MFS transporter